MQKEKIGREVSVKKHWADADTLRGISLIADGKGATLFVWDGGELALVLSYDSSQIEKAERDAEKLAQFARMHARVRSM